MTTPTTNWIKRKNLKNRHVVYWPGTLIDENQYADFTTYFKSEFDITVERKHIIGTVVTRPDLSPNGEEVPGTGGRADFFFTVHEKVRVAHHVRSL